VPSKPINIHQAKTTFSKLIKRVQRGEEITIAKAGKPVAKLAPILPRRARPKFGYGKGTVKVVGEANEPMPDDWLDEFYNSPIFPDDEKPKK
jgi:prevent-host-death family protein